MKTRSLLRQTAALLLMFSVILIGGCRLFVEEFRAFGIADRFVENQDNARMALQAIEADVLPEDDEYYAGRVAAAQILDAYDVWDNQRANEYINLLGQTLAVASDRPVIFAGYRFMILDSDEINGLSTPGGHIFVTRGLLRLAEDEHEVAAILAHEISHVAYRHGAKAIMETRGRNLALRMEAWNYQLESVGAGSTILGRAVGILEERVQSVVNALLGDGYSQDAEIEADLGAVQILLKLGYDPYALVRVLERLDTAYQQSDRRNRTGFNKTHPNPGRRIREIERRLPEQPLTTVNENVIQRRYQAALRGV
jgi:predicted Zn-dependent protease